MKDTKRTILPGVLSPVERFSEILFGLVMTLSITGTLSVVTGGREEVRIMLFSILGCNIAWGIIDGLLYLIGAASDRGRGYYLLNLLRHSSDGEKNRNIVAGVLPPTIARVMLPAELDAISERLAKLPVEPRQIMVTRENWLGAFGVFLLVVLSCVPLIIPFLLIQEPLPALRVSNGIAIMMLFFGGYFLAKYSGTSKLRTGLLMVLLGVVMVEITILLGG